MLTSQLQPALFSSYQSDSCTLLLTEVNKGRWSTMVSKILLHFITAHMKAVCSVTKTLKSLHTWYTESSTLSCPGRSADCHVSMSDSQSIEPLQTTKQDSVSQHQIWEEVYFAWESNPFQGDVASGSTDNMSLSSTYPHTHPWHQALKTVLP